MIIGVIPAAGKAQRMEGIPKFSLPCPGGSLLTHLVDDMVRGGARRVHVMTRDENLKLVQNNLQPEASVHTTTTLTMAETVLAARNLIDSDGVTLFGMPDCYHNTGWPYRRLLDVLRHDIQLAIGVWEITPERRGDFGMCTLSGDERRVTRIVDKAKYSPNQWGWGMMVWRASFWQHIRPDHAHVGFSAAEYIAAGGQVAAVKMPGQIWNCNTQQDYFNLCASWTQKSEAGR